LRVIGHLYRRLFTGFRWSTGGQLSLCTKIARQGAQLNSDDVPECNDAILLGLETRFQAMADELRTAGADGDDSEIEDTATLERVEAILTRLYLRNATNAINLRRKYNKINEAGLYPPAHNSLLAGSIPAVNAARECAT
jgi:hypothetical protein